MSRYLGLVRPVSVRAARVRPRRVWPVYVKTVYVTFISRDVTCRFRVGLARFGSWGVIRLTLDLRCPVIVVSAGWEPLLEKLEFLSQIP